jgi:23S rRNA-/tRNA-specific pseudouridylate synthase
MIDVLYEDDALLFVNKPPGIVVQRGYDPDEAVLLDQVIAHAGHVFLMQRLDRGTSGVMFFSRRADINARLTRQFERKEIAKRYLALCEGCLAEKQTIDAPLSRIGPISFGVRDGGKRAVTGVEPLQATTRGALVGVPLPPGRTHLSGGHRAAMGHRLWGEGIYGAPTAPRPMLHAAELAMRHPLTNGPLRIAAPIPQDFAEEAGGRGLTVDG